MCIRDSYWVLLESVEMRQAPWLLWITDLSIKDPFFILPIIFTFFFLWFPAGLVLYWVVNNILSIGQQWYITRKIEAAAKPANA